MIFIVFNRSTNARSGYHTAYRRGDVVSFHEKWTSEKVVRRSELYKFYVPGFSYSIACRLTLDRRSGGRMYHLDLRKMDRKRRRFLRKTNMMIYENPKEFEKLIVRN